jgi:hypothetical protein
LNVPLQGSAMVIMWHDIAPEGDAAYNLWHTRQHMPERIALPGFLRARRGANKALDRQHYFTLYECADLGAVVSPEYQRSLNSPTEWTQQVAPHFRNFKRMPCVIAASRGCGLGGSIVTVRAPLPAGGEDKARSSLGSAVEAIGALPSTTAVHLGFARPDLSSGETAEVQLRPVMTEPDFGVVVVVEGIGLCESAAAGGEINQLLIEAGLRETICQTYDMAYMLDVASAE